MIFVTIGSAEPFDRLISALAVLDSDSQAELVVQHGSSPPPAHALRCAPFMSFEECLGSIRAARAVITHAGVGTVLTALSEGKRPIVVPRLRALNEAVDDHQLTFASRLADAGLVRLVEDLSLLPDAVVAASEHPSRLQLQQNGLITDLRSYIGTVVGNRRESAAAPGA